MSLNSMNNKKPSDLLLMLKVITVISLVILSIIFLPKPSIVRAQTEPNFQRIRQDDRIIVWKFKDAGNECYVTTTDWYVINHDSGMAMSCVKRGN